MKLLRDILVLCVSVVVMLAVASCSGQSDRPGLVALDSLILQDPDSACELLAAYPADSLPTADDRAYHALLTTIADYKAYRPATTDSVINIALNHYDHNGANQDHRMRSLLYKGCVMEELGDPKQAMRYYKEAQYACSDNDNFHKGYIHFRIGALFQSQFKSQIAIEHFKKSMKYFHEKKDTLYYKTSIKRIGDLYRSINRDSANYYAQRCIEFAKKTNDESLRLFGYTIKAGIYFYNEEWEKSKVWSQKVVEAPTYILRDNDCYYYLCSSYIKLGKLDSAQDVMDLIPSPISSSDSLCYFQCLSNLAEAKQRYNNSIKYQKIPDNINTAIDRKLQDNTLVIIEKNIDSKHKDQNHEKILLRCIVFMILSVLAALLVSAHTRYRHMRVLKDYEIQFSNAKENTKRLINQFERIVEEKDIELSQFQKERDKSESENQEMRKKMITSIEGSLSCYSSILTNVLKQIKASSKEKNSKLSYIMDDDFFAQLYRFVNLRHDNLVDRLRAPEFNLTNEEINIICLDLCKFPNPVIWTYSNCDRYHSLVNKKKIIAKKVKNSNSISDIPQTIHTTL